MVVVHAAQLVASGYLVLAKHPWQSGKLAEYARRLGINVPADALLLRIPPPWAKVRDYLAAASPYQLEAMLNFGEVNAELAGRPLIERLLEVRNRLHGKTYGRTPKVRAPALPKVRMMLEMKKRAMPVAPVAQAPQAQAVVV